MEEKDLVVLIGKSWTYNPNGEVIVLEFLDAKRKLEKENINLEFDGSQASLSMPELDQKVPVGWWYEFNVVYGGPHYLIGVYDRGNIEHINRLVSAGKYAERLENRCLLRSALDD